MNPMQLLKMKSAWDRFQAAHPKFPLFLNSVMQNGIHEGTILEFKVTEPDGRTFCSNLKISREDLELFQELKELAQGLRELSRMADQLVESSSETKDRDA